MGIRVLLVVFFSLVLSMHAIAACPSERQLSGQLLEKREEGYTVYLQVAEGEVIDSVRTENGRFSFCLQTEVFPYYLLKVKEAPSFYYHILTDFSQPTVIEIQSLDKRTVRVQGTDRYERWIAARAQLQILFGKYLEERRKTLNEADWGAAQQRYDQRFGAALSAFLIEDPILGAAVLRAEINRLESIQPSWATATRLREQLRELPPGMENAPVVNYLRRTLGQYIYAREGADILDFTISGLYGNLLSSRDYRGRYLLLDFWGSWCKPCIEKNEELRLRYDELQAENLVVVTIMMDYAREVFDERSLEAALAIDPAYPWPQGILFKDEAAVEMIDYYRAYILPRTVLVDPNGKVMAIDPETPQYILKLISGQKP